MMASLLGMDIVVVADDDERMVNVPRGEVAGDLWRFYVRRSDWPQLQLLIAKRCCLPPRDEPQL
jgi:hypothetical protein